MSRWFVLSTVVPRRRAGMPGTTKAIATLVALTAATTSCSDSSPTAPDPVARVSVLFEYSSHAEPSSPPPVTATGCVHHNQNNRLHGSWDPSRGYREVVGDCRGTCTVQVADVPVGEHVVWFIDLLYCGEDPPPATLEAYESLRANGTPLGRIQDHPSGARGAYLRVDERGVVTP